MKKIALVSTAVSLLAFSCNSQTQLHLDEVLQIKAQKLSVALADTPEKRAQGLSGIPAILEDEGMLFLFSAPSLPEFWMKDMNFPIDIVWINGDKIVAITDSVKPEQGKSDSELIRYSPQVNADKVLEVNSGWAYRHDVNVGDTVTVVKKLKKSAP
jgi:uncharacterized membrane protein (UPF0127 family)